MEETYVTTAAQGSRGGPRRVLPEHSDASLRAAFREDATSARPRRTPNGARARAYHFPHVSIVRDFPLFPLGLVALPSELIPLHIFEERYKTMIGRCRADSSEFGIVWLADDGLRPIGCACEIAEVLEEMP